MPNLLVIDDEESILHFFRRAFPGPDVTPRDGRRRRPRGWSAVDARPARRGRSWTSTCRTSPAWRCSAASTQVDPKIPVIFITGHGTTATAIEAMSLGAYEYLLKPLELDHLSDLVDAGLRDQPADARPRDRSRRAGEPDGRADADRRPLRRPCRRSTRRSAGSPRRT